MGEGVAVFVKETSLNLVECKWWKPGMVGWSREETKPETEPESDTEPEWTIVYR